MDVEEFRNEIIKVTSAALDKPFEEWITFNNKLNTKIINGPYPNLRVVLLNNELPILECNLEDSYLLITTERIVAEINGIADEVFIESIEGFSNKNDALNYKKTENGYPSLNKIALLKQDENILEFFIDSYYPAHFAIMLLQNLRSHKRYKKWYLNPKKKYQ